MSIYFDEIYLHYINGIETDGGRIIIDTVYEPDGYSKLGIRSYYNYNGISISSNVSINARANFDDITLWYPSKYKEIDMNDYEKESHLLLFDESYGSKGGFERNDFYLYLNNINFDGEINIITDGFYGIMFYDEIVFGSNSRINVLPERKYSYSDNPIWWSFGDYINYEHIEYENPTIKIHQGALETQNIENFVALLNKQTIGICPTEMVVSYVSDNTASQHTIFYNGDEFSLSDNRYESTPEIYINPNLPVNVISLTDY
jgi:hypothetical protein